MRNFDFIRKSSHEYLHKEEIVRNYFSGKKSESTEWACKQESGDVSKIDQRDLLPRSCHRLVSNGALLHIDTFFSVPPETGKYAGDGAGRQEVPFRD